MSWISYCISSSRGSERGGQRGEAEVLTSTGILHSNAPTGYTQNEERALLFWSHARPYPDRDFGGEQAEQHQAEQQI
jgi:hypothetical protein